MKTRPRNYANQRKGAESANILRSVEADAQAKIGFLHLISQEGGVIPLKEVARLFGGPSPTPDKAIRKAARVGELIAVKDVCGNLLFPIWQFSERGGVLPGLRETMSVLRQHPHYHDLVPITFMLNRRARLDGKRPLDLLRGSKEGDVRVVLNLAAEAGCWIAKTIGQ